MWKLKDLLSFITGETELAVAYAPKDLRAEAVDLWLDALGGVLAGFHSAVGCRWCVEQRPVIGE